MSDNQVPDSQQGPGMSRRRFMQGSAAVVGTAALLRPLRPSRPGSADSGDQAGFFTLKQTGGQTQGSGSVSLTLPKTASGSGTLLVATLVSPAAGTPFSPPPPPSGTVNAGWQLGKAVTCAGGRVEQWYWANNPGNLYGPGSPAVFQGAAGQTCLGGIAEFASPPRTTQILDTVGKNNGSGAGTSMPVTSAGGVFAGSLGVFSQAEFFGSNVPSGSWTLPAGYSSLAELDSGLTSVWSHSGDEDLTAGYQDPSGGFSYANGSSGWAALACCYRAVVVAPIGVVGGEVTNCLDLDPTGQQLIVGGDVEGCWRSANFGDNWQPADWGAVLSTADQISFADVKWSLLETGVVYACTGKTGTGFGAFLASADGGCTWTQRNSTDPAKSPQLLFDGNGTPSPPRPKAENQDTDRTVNRLIAQDPAGGYLYLVTTNNGVMRSHDKGATWTAIGLGQGYYPRCIAINPHNNQELWVGAWDYNGNGGVWYTADARADQPGWSRLLGYTGTVADLKVLGPSSATYLYAACATGGIYQAPPVASGSRTLVSLNNATGGTIDTTVSIWVTLDGYVDSSGNHQVIAGCSGGVKGPDNHVNIIKLTLAGGATPATYTDLTGSHAIIIDTFPPFDTPWWNASNNWQLWLGGDNSVNPHILIDPNDPRRMYVTGGGGFFRSLNGGDTWQMAISGMPMLGMHCFAIDPKDGTHFVHCGDDYTSIDVIGDPSGHTPGDIVRTSPDKGLPAASTHRESHAVCFDPDGSRLYLGLNYAYSQNAGGAVVYRDPTVPAAKATWTDIGYENVTAFGGAATAPAVTGLISGTDAAGKHFVVAVAQGNGLWRWNSTAWSACTTTDGTPLPGSHGAVGQITPLVAGGGPGLLYCFDRVLGLYRSADYGHTWTQIWTITSSDARAGWLALNPEPPAGKGDELWVSALSSDATLTGLFKLSGANSGTVSGGQISQTSIGGVFSAGAAGIAFHTNGTLYAIALPGTAAPAPAVTTLYACSAPDAAQTSWTDWCNGDGSASSYGPPAGQLGISSAGWLWAAAGEHVGYWDYIPA